MTPYYADESVTLYHGDCREVTAWLEADVLVTDPPYGIAYVSNFAKSGPSKPIAGDGDPLLRDAVLALWGSIRPALVFGRWDVARPGGTRRRLIWDKGNEMTGGDLRIPWGSTVVVSAADRHRRGHLRGLQAHRATSGEAMTPTRVWCFLVHRWWVETPYLPHRDAYRCLRCGEKWNRP